MIRKCLPTDEWCEEFRGLHLDGTLGEIRVFYRSYWGRLVESAIGAHLFNECLLEGIELFYWREGDKEVDFVVRRGRSLTAIEVKSGADTKAFSGMAEFSKAFHPKRMLLVGSGGINIEEFLTVPIATWTK